MTSLARCVGDVADFLDHHWARAPLHRREADPSAFADLLSLGAVDHIVASTSPRLPAFRLVRDGKPLDTARYTRTATLGGKPVPGVGDPRKVLEEFAGGATIVLQGLQRTWEPLTAFCRDLELELTHPVQANAYITPPKSRGLGVHYDTHDVFVLQLAGHKAWEIHAPVLPDPLPSQPWSADRGEPGEAILSVDLRAGDCMYVPRGFLHSAHAQEDLSAHLTIGVTATTWHDVVRQVVAQADREADFRVALTPGYAHDEDALAAEVSKAVGRLRDWLDTVDVEAASRSVARKFWSSRPPILTGQLEQLLSVDRISDGSVVRRRRGAVCHLTPVAADGERIAVLLGDRELRMPAALEPVLRRIAGSTEPFRVSDLSGDLDEPSRLVLTRRLVREGLLEIETVD